MFFGWEGVGLASYLLIGFWHHKPAANAAAVKAFVVNRVGDVGFALGIAGVFALFGSVVFEEILPLAGDLAEDNLAGRGAFVSCFDGHLPVALCRSNGKISAVGVACVAS